jgi:hypothetical protein
MRSCIGMYVQLDRVAGRRRVTDIVLPHTFR